MALLANHIAVVTGAGSGLGAAGARRLARDGVRIVVADSGIGMSEQESARVFDCFYRAPGTSAGVPGTGLGLAIVRSLVGHGIGRDMHEEPQVPNYGPPGKGTALEEGMVLAVEPMVNAGRHMVRMGDDGWAIYSQDGSLAAHFEFTIAITAAGPRILTPWHHPEAHTAAA